MYYWITNYLKTAKTIKIRKILPIFWLLFTLNSTIISQIREHNPFLKWGSWALLQVIPSPVFFEDKNSQSSGLKFGLEWQVIPFSYTFKTNRYVSSLSFFYVKPVKRFTGSFEVFFEPSLIVGDFKYSDQRKFSFRSGGRIVLPIFQNGEYLSFSIGTGYFYQKTKSGELIDGIAYEAGIYSFFGMLGLKFNYNQNGISRYNMGVYFKYY